LVKNYCFFKSKELLGLYKNWKVLYYNEYITGVFQKDKEGNNLNQKMVIIIAKRL